MPRRSVPRRARPLAAPASLGCGLGRWVGSRQLGAAEEAGEPPEEWAHGWVIRVPVGRAKRRGRVSSGRRRAAQGGAFAYIVTRRARFRESCNGANSHSPAQRAVSAGSSARFNE
jgi:hypothetical protein